MNKENASDYPRVFHHFMRGKHKRVYKRITYSPCLKSSYCKSLECLNTITAEDILEKIEELVIE